MAVGDGRQPEQVQSRVRSTDTRQLRRVGVVLTCLPQTVESSWLSKTHPDLTTCSLSHGPCPIPKKSLPTPACGPVFEIYSGLRTVRFEIYSGHRPGPL